MDTVVSHQQDFTTQAKLRPGDDGCDLPILCILQFIYYQPLTIERSLHAQTNLQFLNFNANGIKKKEKKNQLLTE